MLMHAITGRGCTDTGRESAPEVDSGRKIPCRTEDLEPASVLRLAFQFDGLQTELSWPLLLPSWFKTRCFTMGGGGGGGGAEISVTINSQNSVIHCSGYTSLRWKRIKKNEAE